MKPHSDTDRLREALARCENLVQAWAGVVYRSASVAYANRDDLLTGSGAKRAGDRWNPMRGRGVAWASLVHNS
ncbi:MAG TPA: hypothetical protein VMV69_25725 [Pirellulales bacterium]|nr:hypothetical protein [Pirellulales bacterium]